MQKFGSATAPHVLCLISIIVYHKGMSEARQSSGRNLPHNLTFPINESMLIKVIESKSKAKDILFIVYCQAFIVHVAWINYGKTRN